VVSCLVRGTFFDILLVLKRCFLNAYKYLLKSYVMKNLIMLIFGFFLMCSLSLFAQTQMNDSTVVKWTTSFGSDGRVVAHPSNWKTSFGADGIIIAYPSDWTTSFGADGRIIAYPKSWTTSIGVDGRIIAHPKSWGTAIGIDGRIVAYPSSANVTIGTDGRIVSTTEEMEIYLAYLLINRE
jgi:hypothetical protein